MKTRRNFSTKLSSESECRSPRLGEVYLLKFDGVDQEQRGLRPALVISNNKGNKYSPNVIVLPLTTAMKHLNQPTHVLVKARESGLQYDSMVLCENPVCVSKKRLIKFLTTLQPQQLEEISIAYLLATGTISQLSEEQIIDTRKRALTLDATKVA